MGHAINYRTNFSKNKTQLDPNDVNEAIQIRRIQFDMKSDEFYHHGTARNFT